jgi:hypothetical protein
VKSGPQFDSVSGTPELTDIHESGRELEMLVDNLNAGRPQCPVGLNTLVVPRHPFLHTPLKAATLLQKNKSSNFYNPLLCQKISKLEWAS